MSLLVKARDVMIDEATVGIGSCEHRRKYSFHVIATLCIENVKDLHTFTKLFYVDNVGA